MLLCSILGKILMNFTISLMKILHLELKWWKILRLLLKMSETILEQSLILLIQAAQLIQMKPVKQLLDGAIHQIWYLPLKNKIQI